MIQLGQQQQQQQIACEKTRKRNTQPQLKINLRNPKKPKRHQKKQIHEQSVRERIQKQRVCLHPEEEEALLLKKEDRRACFQLLEAALPAHDLCLQQPLTVSYFDFRVTSIVDLAGSHFIETLENTSSIEANFTLFNPKRSSFLKEENVRVFFLFSPRFFSRSDTQ